MPKTLDLLAQKGQFHLPIELQSKLASRGFTEIISKSANGKHKRKLAFYENCRLVCLFYRWMPKLGLKAFQNILIYCVSFACTMLIF